MSPLIRFRKLAILFAMFAVVSFGSAVAARADTVTLDLNVGSTLPNQNYGTVKLTLVGSDIKVEVSLLAGNRIVNTGFDASVAFNSTIGGLIGVTGLPGTYTLVNNGIESSPNAIKMDGFGVFEYGVLFKNQGGGAGTDSSLTFTVTRAGGFSSVFQLLELSEIPPGEHRSPFAVDIICDSCNNGNGATGVVGTTIPTQTVPEPASMMLLGTGLIGVAAAFRKRLHR